MLEQAGLLLCPWRWEKPAPGDVRPTGARSGSVRVRSILDLHTRQHLGLVRLGFARAWPVFRWLARQVWQVLESEDESLLLTVYGPWGLIRPSEVCDADDRLVCSIHGGEIRDASGCLRARAIRAPGRIDILGKDRIALGHLALRSDGLEVRFAASIDADPYAKMAVLGAALSIKE
jgi:hypothetical protein